MISSLSRRSTAAVLLALLAIASVGIAGVATAQDGAANATSNEIQNYQIQIDPEVRLVSSEWDGSTVTMIFESDVTRQVTITDASVQEVSGARNLRRQTETVLSQEQKEITFTVENSDVRKVTASTPYGIVLVGESHGSGYNPDPVPFVGVLVLIGIASIGTGGLTFWAVRNSRETDEKTVERVA